MTDEERRAKNRDRQRAWRSKQGPEYRIKVKAQWDNWYNNKGGKESTRTRKGYMPMEEYIVYRQQLKEQANERRKSANSGEFGQRKRCARTIYRSFRRLGFNIDLYDEMYDRQDGKCAICEESRPRYGQKRMHIDHCHSTNRIRGLLCSMCNSALGGFRDNVNYMASAISYIESTRQAEVA